MASPRGFDPSRRNGPADLRRDDARCPEFEQGQAVNWDDIITDAAATDTGMRRSNNQDSHAVVRAAQPRGLACNVAICSWSPMAWGAHAVGELASKMACDNIPFNYNKSRKRPPPPRRSPRRTAKSAPLIYSLTANRDFQGMGTTCTTLLLLPEGALLAHVGDSRCYRIRNRRIDQLSFDHSMVWELMKRKLLPPDQAAVHIHKNVITRSLGPDPEVEVDIEGPLAVEPNDVFLLCSDGLTGPVADPELGVFAENFHPKDACRYLIHLANLRGGPDNITTVILRVGAWTEPDTAQDVPVTAGPVSTGNGRPRAGWKEKLGGLFGGRGRHAGRSPWKTTPIARPNARSRLKSSRKWPISPVACRHTRSITPGRSTGRPLRSNAGPRPKRKPPRIRAKS